MFVILDDFSNREEPELVLRPNCQYLAQTIRTRRCPTPMVAVFPAPPVRGVGRTGGFKFMVEDRGDVGLTTLQGADRQPGGEGQPAENPQRRPLLVGLFSVFRANAPQLYVDMNRKQCMTMGVPLVDAFNTLQVYLGSLYVNDFNLFGRTWQVIVQADAPFRNQVERVKQFKVRNQHRRHGADRGPRRRARSQRSADPHPLQHVSRPPPSTATRDRASVPDRPST